MRAQGVFGEAGMILPETGMAEGTSSDAGPTPGVLFCVAPDFAAQKVYYAAPRPVADASATRARKIGLRFAQAVQAQDQVDLGAGRGLCSTAPTNLGAATALRRALTPLLSQGYVAVPMGVF